MTFDLTNLPPLSSLSPDKLRALHADLEELYAEVESQEPDDEETGLGGYGMSAMNASTSDQLRAPP